MLIELRLAEPYDGLTRILQVLRLAECGLRSLDASRIGTAHHLRLDLDVPAERIHLVEARLAGVIGVEMVSVRGHDQADLRIAA